MTKDSDPVSVTLTRAQWLIVKRVLDMNGFIDKPATLRAVERALDPRAPIAPNPATFQVVEPDPKRTKPWPELKSSQDADDASSHG